MGVPTGNDLLYPQDVLVVYGKEGAINALKQRKPDATGEAARVAAVKQENQRLKPQETRERLREI